MSICDSIKKKFIRLSKGQRKVAQFVVDNPNVVATQVASEVGRQAGVSESTVIRFCYAMDLSGFSELQQQMKDYLMEKDGVLPGRARVKQAHTYGHEVMANDLSILENTMQKIDVAVLEEAAQQLHSAHQIFILGVRSCAPAAFWLYNKLNGYRSNVNLMTHDEQSIASDVIAMNEKSVLFVVGVNEQQEDVMAVVELARRKGLKVVAITDNIPCPLQKNADYLFTIGTSEQGFIACDVAVISLLHALVESMIAQHKKVYTAGRTINTQPPADMLLTLK